MKTKLVKNDLAFVFVAFIFVAFIFVLFVFAAPAAQSQPALPAPHLNQRLPPTIALNIYKRLLDAAKVPPSPPAVSSPKRLLKIIKGKVGELPITCKLTLTPAGEISDLVIVKSSGSGKRDRKAIRFIRSAAPFGPNEMLGPSDYLVELPVLSVSALGY